VIGTERGSQGPSCALLACESDDGLQYRDSAFVTLPSRQRELFWRRADELSAKRPARSLSKRDTAWLEPEMRVRAKFLRGEGKLRMPLLRMCSRRVEVGGGSVCDWNLPPKWR
jgi:hypothetical protein